VAHRSLRASSTRRRTSTGCCSRSGRRTSSACFADAPRPVRATSWPNLWLGRDLEDKRYDRVIPPARGAGGVHFLSCEPLLEHVSPNLDGIDWVIIGGESGGGARRFNVAWARSLVAQCREAGVAPFVKQMGSNVIDRNDAGFNGEDDDGWHSAVEYGGDIRVEHDIDGYRDDYQGAPVRVHLRDHHGGDMAEWPADLRVREFPEVRP
jgi:hypothetical protein